MRLRPPTIRRDQRRLGEQTLQHLGQRRPAARAAVAKTGVPNCLQVLRRVVDHDAVAEGHRLHQRRMRAAHLGGLDEDQRVAGQLGVGIAELVAGEDDRGVAPRAGLERGDVLRDVGRVAGDHTFHIRRGAPLPAQGQPGLHQVMGAVLRHQPADEQHVAARHQAEAPQDFARRARRHVRAIRDEDGLRPVCLSVVCLHAPRVGDHDVGEAGRQALRPADVALGKRAPLAALPVQPVHIKNNPRLAEQARDQAERGVAGDEDDQPVVALAERVQERDGRMAEGIEVLGGQAGHAHQAHALIRRRGVAHVVGAVIDGDGMAAPRQPHAELLGAGLEAGIRGRHATRADQGDAHASILALDSMCLPHKRTLPLKINVVPFYLYQISKNIQLYLNLSVVTLGLKNALGYKEYQ